MKHFLSLRWKLTALIAGGGVVAALMASAGFSWLDLSRSRASTYAQVEAIGNIVADQAAPAIMLADRKSATETLTSLRAHNLVKSAALYDGRAACFAAFDVAGGRACPHLPADGIYAGGDALALARPVTAGDDRVGTLLLIIALPSVIEVLKEYLGGTALVIALTLVVAAIVAVSLQSRVSTPILDIARVAERITKSHCFEDRVAVSSSDELGILANSFNAMLDELQRRNLELAKHRQSLEEEVAERSRVNAELRVAKEKAEEAARLKSEFLANMSHEIRTPMNGVMGMLSLVLETCSDREEREHLLVAQSAAQSLITILNDILDLSKMEAGKMTIEAIDFDLRGAFTEALRIFDTAVNAKGLRLNLTFGRGCPSWVCGDSVRLRQMLMNLVGNAVKFTAEGSVVASVAAAGEGLIRFEVRDTGIGIEPSKLNSIFEPFTQADGSHSRQFGGTGLGLTITRRLVNLMGGRMWAESAPGEGSSFYVELPMVSRAEPAPAPAAPQALPSLPALKVLVAEDNPVNQKVIRSLLRRQGWTVTMAGNGQEAYEQFRQEPFDLVLMDIQMPEVDGLEATRLIRHEEERRSTHTPVIALTAHASQAQHDQCLAEGMDAVITKPVNLGALLEAIAEVIRCVPASG